MTWGLIEMLAGSATLYLKCQRRPLCTVEPEGQHHPVCTSGLAGGWSVVFPSSGASEPRFRLLEKREFLTKRNHGMIHALTFFMGCGR